MFVIRLSWISAIRASAGIFRAPVRDVNEISNAFSVLPGSHQQEFDALRESLVPFG
jgi:hypothetical protein